MDDLLAYLIALIMNDAPMQAIFNSVNGSPTVIAYSPNLRAETSYPRILLWGEEGMMEESGGLDPTVFDGVFRIDIYTRSVTAGSVAAADAYGTLVKIKQRLGVLVLGNPKSDPIVAETRGTCVGDYFVNRFYQIRPTGRVPVMGDPTVRRWQSTYKVMLTRHLFTEGV